MHPLSVATARDVLARPLRRSLVRALEEVLPATTEAAIVHCERVMPSLVAAPGRDRGAGLAAAYDGWMLRLRQAADGREQTPREKRVIDEYLDGAARRGIPLDLQLEINRRLTAHVMRQYWSTTGPDSVDEMLYLSDLTASWLRAEDQRFVDAYVRVHGPDEALRSVRTAVTAALLDGRTAPVLTEQVSLDPPPYLVVLVAGALPADTAPPLHVVRDGATVCVLPLRAGGRAQAERLSRASDGVVVAQVAPSVEAVPGAYAMARRLLAARPLLAAAREVVLPTDAVPELLLTAGGADAGDARDELLAVLARLDRQPELVDTLVAYLRLDFDQWATATVLGVHRRTVHARLLRIADLTGHDPRTTRGIQVLGLALTAARLTRPARAVSLDRARS